MFYVTSVIEKTFLTSYIIFISSRLSLTIRSSLTMKHEHTWIIAKKECVCQHTIEWVIFRHFLYYLVLSITDYTYDRLYSLYFTLAYHKRRIINYAFDWNTKTCIIHWALTAVQLQTPLFTVKGILNGPKFAIWIPSSNALSIAMS